MEDPPELPNAHGHLEYARIHDHRLVLRGWMVDADGAFESVRAFVGDEPFEGQRIDRPDLNAAFGRITNAAEAGFHCELPSDRVDAQGAIEFTIVGRRRGRAIAAMHAGWLRSSERMPMPPAHLMQRVAHTDLDYLFAAGGMKAACNYRRVVRRSRPGWAPARILDWGCGSGRVTAYLPELFLGASVDGTDIDGEAVAWAAKNLQGVAFLQCGLQPPLPFAAAQFDLVLAGSVFTHLDVAHQEQWLAEIRRVLRPGGVLVATTLGEFAATLRAADPQLLARIRRDGIDDRTLDRTLDAVIGAGYYRATWQSTAWTAASWGRTLRVSYHEPAGYENYQDLWLLER